jgi:hypothetical protein
LYIDQGCGGGTVVPAKHDIERCGRAAEERGGRCLSTEYINGKTKLQWRCAKGHEWYALWNNIHRGQWCPNCGRERRSISNRGKRRTEKTKEKMCIAWKTSKKYKEMIERQYEARFKQCQMAAKVRGGKCLEIWPYNNRRGWRGRFLCNHGHVWTAEIAGVFHGHWCAKCNYGTPTIDQCRKIAEERGYEFLSKEAPLDQHQLLKWKCHYCGCEWQNNLNHFLRGQGCPNCRKHYHDMENRTRIILEHIFHKPFTSCRPFQATGSRLEIDCYNKELKNFGMEWDGEQHRKPFSFMGGEKGLEKVRAHDHEKDVLCKQNNIRLIRINGLEATTITLVDVIMNKLSENGISFSKPSEEILSKLRNPLDPIYTRIWGRKHLEKFREVCNSHINPITGHNGELLSADLWVGNTYNYNIRCEFNHLFKGNYNHIVDSNRWCPICARNQPVGIERCRQHALKNGGKCLSTEYINSKTKLHWQCEKGHEWHVAWDSIEQGHWCPICTADRLGKAFKIEIEQCRRLAEEHGGQCLSREYKNNRTKLHWRCAEGHEWYASYSNVHQWHWCPKCGAEQVWITRRKNKLRSRKDATLDSFM